MEDEGGMVWCCGVWRVGWPAEGYGYLGLREELVRLGFGGLGGGFVVS